jgi:hypothetical protein
MAPEVDYLPIAVGAGANVDTQSDFNGSGYQEQGFSSGLAQSKQLNKCWRQASMVAAAIANFIANVLGVNVLDDGNLTNLVSQFTAAVEQAGSALIVVPFSATPVFNLASGTKFAMTLTGNVTSSSVSGAEPGDVVYFCIHQDATGGRTFAWPSAVPGGTIDSAANSTTMQAFFVDDNGNWQAFTPTMG